MRSSSPTADELCLSSSTLEALNEFLAEQKQHRQNGNLDENWQLSQFWYTDDTCRQLVNECICALDRNGRVACLCCPSLIPLFLETKELKHNNLEVHLFEFDKRFEQKYPDSFIYYDYNHPLDVPSKLYHSFDFIIADPPFLSDECFVKVAQTVRLLSKPDACKVLINTGDVMEQLLQRILGLQKTNFKPSHKNNLANAFSTFTNYSPSIL